MLESLNYLGRERIPTFFIIDYELNNSYIIPINQLDGDIKFEIDGYNYQKSTPLHHIFKFDYFSSSFDEYNKKFNFLQNEIKKGNTYLANLTIPTKIETNVTLYELYLASKAKFKLYFKDKFIVFSPERFIKIDDNIINTYPMKGTIDALIPNAKEILLADKKELAEHIMIVDLLRNDINMVASNVKLKKFRYIEKIKTHNGEILQTSSHISGKLEDNWQNRLGEIMLKLLPAGSITGTPKIKTIEILKKIEEYDRGYFSGIFGYFDGNSLDSAVMIRYIEKNDKNLVFKSGGGITADSNSLNEFQEMQNKIYVPIY